MLSKMISPHVLWLPGCLVALLLILSFENMQFIQVIVFGIQCQTQLGLLIVLGLLLGGMNGFYLCQAVHNKQSPDKQKLEWQAQDAKLIAEVRTDREKQLEAKIQTLETALKQALKKS